jgi:flagellar biosynthetic protein FlhB
MSEQQGDKSEQPTMRRMEEAIKQGQFAKSAEIQTVFVLSAAVCALLFTGLETWDYLANTMRGILSNLHLIPVSFNTLPAYSLSAAWVVAKCVGPVVIGAMVGGLLAGVIQNRFNTSSEALRVNWDRLNPVNGFERVFSMRQAMPTLLAIIKLTAILGLSYGTIQSIISDPIFYTAVGVERIAGFLAESVLKIFVRLLFILGVIAASDYGYQWWRTHQDLMMTKEEVKEESKSSEGNPEMKAAQRRNRKRISQRKMLADIPTADVVITNPTHIAIALKYDQKKMKAPIIVAKGIRLNAMKIREIAQQHQVPILENKPLARMMFKHGKVGGEIPAQLYVAVAEILAWVYRMNRYRYYAQENQATQTQNDTASPARVD